MAGTSGAEDEDSLPTYKDAFPPLPEKPLPEGVQETGNAWTTKIRPLKSSVITQVQSSSMLQSLSPRELVSGYMLSCHIILSSECEIADTQYYANLLIYLVSLPISELTPV